MHEEPEIKINFLDSQLLNKFNHLNDCFKKIRTGIENREDIQLLYPQPIHIKWKNNVLNYGFNDRVGKIYITLDKPSQTQFIKELKNISCTLVKAQS